MKKILSTFLILFPLIVSAQVEIVKDSDTVRVLSKYSSLGCWYCDISLNTNNNQFTLRLASDNAYDTKLISIPLGNTPQTAAESLMKINSLTKSDGTASIRRQGKEDIRIRKYLGGWYLWTDSMHGISSISKHTLSKFISTLNKFKN